MSFGFLAAKDFQIIWFFNLLIKSIPDEGYSRSKRVVWTKLDISIFIATHYYIISALMVSMPGDSPHFSDYTAFFNDKVVKSPMEVLI